MTPDPRRLALVLLALIHVGMAASVLAPGSLDPDRAVLYEAIPPRARVVLWVACGAVALIGALWQRWQWLGFAAAVLMPVERAVSHLWSWLAWMIPGVPSGDRHGWSYALIWAALAGLVTVLAGVAAPATSERRGG